jgi:uncharacterized protein (TIGR02300 family)
MGTGLFMNLLPSPNPSAGGRRDRLADQRRRGRTVAKTELGTKRIDPETGRKFYDLNKDPIVSPYTGKNYPRSYFETESDNSVEEEEEVEKKELDEEDADTEVVSLEEADEEASGTSDDKVDLGDDDDVDLGDDDDDDTFLEEEEEEDDDVSGIIGVGDDDEET